MRNLLPIQWLALIAVAVFAVGCDASSAIIPQETAIMSDGGLSSPSPAGIVFESDWSSVGKATTLDQSAAAIMDGGKWPNATIDRLEGATGVITTDGLGFPSGMVNVYRVGYHGMIDGVWGAGKVYFPSDQTPWQTDDMAIGETLFHRIYYRNSIHNQSGDLPMGGSHPYQGSGTDERYGRNCAFTWNWKFGSDADGTFPWGFFQETGGRFGGYMLPKGIKDQVYMIETAFTKTAEHLYIVRVRIDGVERTSEMGIPSTPREIGNNCLSSVFVGNNDPGWYQDDFSALPGGPFTNQDFMYWGGFAVKISADSDDWIGPY